jgi:hypothetical protein
MPIALNETSTRPHVCKTGLAQLSAEGGDTRSGELRWSSADKSKQLSNPFAFHRRDDPELGHVSPAFA